MAAKSAPLECCAGDLEIYNTGVLEALSSPWKRAFFQLLLVPGPSETVLLKEWSSAEEQQAPHTRPSFLPPPPAYRLHEVDDIVQSTEDPRKWFELWFANGSVVRLRTVTSNHWATWVAQLLMNCPRVRRRLVTTLYSDPEQTTVHGNSPQQLRGEPLESLRAEALRVPEIAAVVGSHPDFEEISAADAAAANVAAAEAAGAVAVTTAEAAAPFPGAVTSAAIATTAKPYDLSLCWETLKDPRTGLLCYYNDAVQVRQCEMPSGSSSSPVLLLPLGWHACFHASRREVYFYNKARSETKWDCPPGHLLLPEPRDIVNDQAVYWETFVDREGRPYYYQACSRSTCYDKPSAVVLSGTPGQSRGKLPVMLPPGWCVATTEAQALYFVNMETNETQWDLPEGSCTVATAPHISSTAHSPHHPSTALMAASGGRAAPSPTRRALCIGVNAYEHTETLAPLKGCIHDAEDVGAVLAAHGFELHILRNPSGLQLHDAIETLVGECRDGDKVLVLLAGHGGQWENDNYLFPVDFGTKSRGVVLDLPKDALAVHAGIVTRLQQKNPNGLSVVIADMCRSTTRFRHQEATRAAVSSQFAKPEIHGSGVLVAFACEQGHTSQDTGRNGVYTSTLLKYLARPMHVEDMLGVVGTEVKRITATSSDPMRPWNSGSLDRVMNPATDQPYDIILIEDAPGSAMGGGGGASALVVQQLSPPPELTQTGVLELMRIGMAGNAHFAEEGGKALAALSGRVGNWADRAATATAGAFPVLAAAFNRHTGNAKKMVHETLDALGFEHCAEKK